MHTKSPSRPKSSRGRTNHPAYADSWAAVEDYQRYLDVAARNPNRGSAALATKLELPRGRIRGWEDGSIPDAARAVQVADERDWFDGPTSDQFRALNQLVAWVFSGGSISAESYTPSFAVEKETEHRATDALDTLGVEWRREREDDQHRATEIVPTEHASVLGRALVTLGAPQGEKNDQAKIDLPDYLDDAPEKIRAAFVDVYLRNRAQTQEGKRLLLFREDRSNQYLREIAALIEDVSGESVTVSEKNVVLSSAAADALYGKLNRPF